MKTILIKRVLMAVVMFVSIFSLSHTVEASTNQIPKNAVYFNGHYYSIYKTRITWDDAKLVCEENGGYLATITSSEEWNFIQQLNTDDAYLWLGGYADEKRNWHWVTGEEWDYTAWCEGEPNNEYNSGEDKLQTWDNGWNDNDNEADGFMLCSGYICEWDYYTLNLSYTDVTLNIKDSIYVTYNVINYSGEVSATWKSSDTSVAKVSSTGKIVAVGAGTCKITCKSLGLSKTIKIVVRPKKVSGICLVSKTNNMIQLKWKKQPGVTKYQIQVYDKDLEEYTVVKNVKSSLNIVKIKNLKRNTKYKFKIRACVKSGVKNYYGEFSKVYKCKTRK